MWIPCMSVCGRFSLSETTKTKSQEDVHKTCAAVLGFGEMGSAVWSLCCSCKGAECGAQHSHRQPTTICNYL